MRLPRPFGGRGGRSGRPAGRGRWIRRLAVVTVVVSVLYLVVTFGQVWAASRQDDRRAGDAIVVLGAAQFDCRPSPVLQRRLDRAFELYRGGAAPVIVVTGGKQDGDRCTEAETGANYLRGQGVPDADLLLEVQGRNTWESLAAATRILNQRDLHRVVLVTDGYHALRARGISGELGLDAVVSPSNDSATLGQLLRETGAVAVGRITGFRRLVQIDDRFVRSQ